MLQILLEKRGHDPGELNGQFGPATKTAVQEFQKVNGLAPNGIVGAETWEALRMSTVSGEAAGATGKSGAAGAAGRTSAESKVKAGAVKGGRKKSGSVSEAVATGLESAKRRRQAMATAAKWGLIPGATGGAIELLMAVPTVFITSGQRTRDAEARAWASNIAGEKDWMACLAAHGRPEIVAVQTWLNDNWQQGEMIAGKASAISAKLVETFANISDAEMAKISNHFDGLAIDILPDPQVSRSLLEGLPNQRQVLDEGGHWHIAFKRT